MHAIADDPEARVYSYDIINYKTTTYLEDADERFRFHQKSQADFDPADVDFRPVDVAFFDAGHSMQYNLLAFERLLPTLSPGAFVIVHDTGLHVLDHRFGAPEAKEKTPWSEESCARLNGGPSGCHRFPGCDGTLNEHGFCIGQAHRPSERKFVRALLSRWQDFRPLHVHSRRIFRHGLTLLQRGTLWDPLEAHSGEL
eukprot:gnl/TRDRNA2_/TRDRNA2_131594_c0_seq1.p2 gnl/TRDRNA2_/TRDRNA2_131594_c0~~gnl/TRDRNA2_/TRDRNA2_131594_c0_seq1.p2  ORF type:complete len:198 (-),score=20.30 gnl/TRDRNA2_/TRDRNA2_131594_c0_seq1:168-761(-)